MSPKTIAELEVSQNCSRPKALQIWCNNWMHTAEKAEAKGNTVVMFEIPKKNEGIYLKAIDELIEKMKLNGNQTP